MEKNTTYDTIYFSGSGFYLTYHFGVIKCLNDNNIRFRNAYGISGGVHACLALFKVTNYEQALRNCFILKDRLKFYTANSFFLEYRKIVDGAILDFDKSKNINIGVLNLLKMKKEWKGDFKTKNELVEYTLLSSTVVPFLKLYPYFYKGSLYVDAIGTSKLPIACNLWVSPFNVKHHNTQMLISGKYKINKCLFISKEEMKEAFVEGYNDTKKNIIEPVNKTDPKNFINSII